MDREPTAKLIAHLRKELQRMREEHAPLLDRAVVSRWLDRLVPK
jgi:hypothetical protein